MPPKKQKKDDIQTDGKIVNMYEKIPKELLTKADNPNKHLHNLDLAMRMVVVAPSGVGKTNFVVNLLSLFSAGKGSFQSIHIITANADEPLYNWLKQKSNGQIVIKEGVRNTPPLDKFDKELNHLVIWDDLVLAKDLSMVETMYLRGRKMGVSCIFIAQSYFKIPKMIRNNCNYMVLLKLSGQREVNVILSEFGLGVSKDELLKIYDYATDTKFSPLVIDMTAPPKERFRKGLLEIIDVNEL
tara:strand:+ start:155 stop:880 length:726 start_codon:yes stop_codon:yes gene_type:complete